MQVHVLVCFHLKYQRIWLLAIRQYHTHIIVHQKMIYYEFTSLLTMSKAFIKYSANQPWSSVKVIYWKSMTSVQITLKKCKSNPESLYLVITWWLYLNRLQITFKDKYIYGVEIPNLFNTFSLNVFYGENHVKCTVIGAEATSCLMKIFFRNVWK